MWLTMQPNFRNYPSCPHCNDVDVEGSKCVNFESGMHLEINQFICYQEIHHFSVLVNKCRIYDEDGKSRPTHYKSVNSQKDKKFCNKNSGKPYEIPSAKKIRTPQLEVEKVMVMGMEIVGKVLRLLKDVENVEEQVTLLLSAEMKL